MHDIRKVNCVLFLSMRWVFCLYFVLTLSSLLLLHAGMNFNKSCDHCRRIKRTCKRLRAHNSCQNCMAKKIRCIYSLSVQGQRNDLLLSGGGDRSSTVRFDISAPGRPSSPVIEVIDPMTELHSDDGSSDSILSRKDSLSAVQLLHCSQIRTASTMVSFYNSLCFCIQDPP